MIRLGVLILLFCGSLVHRPASLRGQEEEAVNHSATSPQASLSLDGMAPEQKLAYFSWTGWNDFQSDRSLTEKWLSQPEMKVAFDRVKNQLLKLAEEQLPPSEFQQMDRSIHWSLQLMQHPGLFCLYQLDWDEASQPEVSAILVSHMGEQSVEAQRWLLEYLQKAPSVSIQETKVGDLAFQAIEMSGSPTMYLGVVDENLVISLGTDAVENWLRDRETPEPMWIVALKQKYDVGHITAVLDIDLAAIYAVFADQIPEDAKRVVTELGADGLQHFSIVYGVAPRGSIMRGGLQVQQPMRGLFQLLATAETVTPQSLAGVDPKAEQVFVVQLPLDRILPYIHELAGKLQFEDPSLEPLQTLSDQTGIDVEQLLNSLSGRVTVYGAMTMPNPQRGYNIGLGLRDRELFQQQLDAVISYAREALGDQIEVEIEEETGYTRHLFKLGLQRICVDVSDEQIIYSVNSRALTRYWKRIQESPADGSLSEENIAGTPPLDRFFSDPAFGDRKFLLVSKVDYRPYIKFIIPTITLMFQGTLPGTDLSTDDIPPVDVLINYMEPSLYGIYQGPNGFEFYYQQTAPLLSPGVSTPVLVGFLLPAVQAARAAARRAQSQNQLRAIGLALYHFQAEHGKYPARYSVDANGQPLLSWRVHLLPYLGEQELYEQFHLDEPWDSEHNLTLLDAMPDCYLNSSMVPELGNTSYQVIGKENALMTAPEKPQGEQAIPLSRQGHQGWEEAEDVLPLMLESPVLVPWSAPQDFEDTSAAGRRKLRTNVVSGISVLMPNGSINFYQMSSLDQLPLSNDQF